MKINSARALLSVQRLPIDWHLQELVSSYERQISSIFFTFFINTGNTCVPISAGSISPS